MNNLLSKNIKLSSMEEEWLNHAKNALFYKDFKCNQASLKDASTMVELVLDVICENDLVLKEKVCSLMPPIHHWHSGMKAELFKRLLEDILEGYAMEYRKEIDKFIEEFKKLETFRIKTTENKILSKRVGGECELLQKCKFVILWEPEITLEAVLTNIFLSTFILTFDIPTEVGKVEESDEVVSKRYSCFTEEEKVHIKSARDYARTYIRNTEKVVEIGDFR